MVIGRAIISDLSSGRAAARAFSLMMIVGGVAPVVAPLIGSLLVGPLGWRGLLWVVFALATLMFIAIAVVVRESHTPDRRAASPQDRTDTSSAKSGLGSSVYLGNTLAFGFAFAVMMAYISASPFVYQVMIGLSATQYGLLFGANALGLVAVSAMSAKLAATRDVSRTLQLGLILVFAATVALVLLVVLDAPVGWLPVPIFVAVASLGLVLGNATTLALAAVPRAAGSASAVLGALQFALAAAVSPLVSLGGETTALPLAIVMITLAAIALVSSLIARHGPQPGS